MNMAHSVGNAAHSIPGYPLQQRTALVYHFTTRWYTCVVPTTRPRYQVTETPAVARALDRAAKRWPGEPRSKLLLRLVEAGSNVLEDDENTDQQAHRAAILASAGRYPEAYGPDYLAELRADWPT